MLMNFVDKMANGYKMFPWSSANMAEEEQEEPLDLRQVLYYVYTV
jgi:hypothetical protein